jgi:TonB family protein
LYWIRVLAEKPAAKPAVPAAATPVARPAAPAAAVAANPPVSRTATLASDARQAANVKVANAVPSAAGVTTDAGTPAVGTESGRAANAAAPHGIDAGLSSPAVAAGLAAPALTPPPVDVAPPEVEEPDPGLIMTKSVNPEFPMTVMRRLRKGEVEVRFEVSSGGQVEVVSVVRTTNASLNNAALEAVRQWQFKPTPKGHTAVVDLAFDLDS